ncbi:PREDICTED: protein very KIND-like, partial [Chinchilla lanigera]|uniref:protein very KIND-like n=1 Tax=Chinchilla lanigera TaxID=34839 RepID=UPI00038EE308
CLSLQDLLSKLGRPFREYELWALCLACLSALQKHTEHPACLCLDNVLVAEDGTVLFGPPPANGAYNSFFLAPEVAEEKLVTEKVSGPVFSFGLYVPTSLVSTSSSVHWAPGVMGPKIQPPRRV